MSDMPVMTESFISRRHSTAMKILGSEPASVEGINPIHGTLNLHFTQLRIFPETNASKN